MHIKATENKGLSKIQQYVMHLRFTLAYYLLDGIEPPEYLLKELKTAECLARVEIRECKKFRQQVVI